MSHLSPLPHYFFVPPTKSGLPRGLNRSSFLDTPILSGHGLDPVVELTTEDSAWTILGPYQQRASLPFAGVHPETLQHAAQRLRPTVYRESLLPHEREQFLDGSDQLATGRYWQNQPQHDTLAQHQTGTTIHATHDYSHQSPAFGLNSGYSPSKSSYSPTPSPINSFIKQTSQQTTFNHRQSPLLQQQQHQQSSSSSQQQQLINDPKRYIHAYATQTPVATLMTGQNGGGIRGENNFGRENDFVANNGSGGIHLRKQNVDNFVKELRDQGLTERQRVANQQQKPVNYSTSEPPPSLQNFVSYKQKIINSSNEENKKEEDSVDQLIKEMEWKMRSGYGAAGESKRNFF
uniref:Uncharacterized protein n=1 Tax=Meloidogyne javanica TaxID=6303 RepID=A0A915N5B3_MELJA